MYLNPLNLLKKLLGVHFCFLLLLILICDTVLQDLTNAMVCYVLFIHGKFFPVYKIKYSKLAKA